MAVELDVPFALGNPWEFPLYGVPLRASVPLALGTVKEPAAELALVDAQGKDVGAQWRVLARWRDKSARFALLDYAAAGIAPRTTLKYRLIRRPVGLKPPALPQDGGIRIDDAADQLTVDTGRLRWVFSKKRFALGESIVFNGRDWVDGQETDLVVADVNGQVFRASRGAYKISLEEPGPHRVVVLIEGDFGNPAGKFMDYKLRLHFVGGGAQVLLSHTIRNRHDGREGRDVRRWALTGALNIGNASLRRILQSNRGLNTVNEMAEVPENVDLDTGDIQTTIRNPASLRESPEDICGTFKTGRDITTYGKCASLLDLIEPGVGGLLLKFAMPEPEREGPLHLGSDGRRFDIDFYPDEPGVSRAQRLPRDPRAHEAAYPGFVPPMHLNEGMGKTRDVLLNFHDESLSPLNRVYESNNVSYPGVTGVPAALYRQVDLGDIQHALLPQRNKYPLLESKIDMLLSAPQAYDWPKATGWRDWGDEVGARGRCLEFGIQQYINNEEDYLYCVMIDAWRHGRPCTKPHVARHLMDIDYIDYSPDPGRDGADCAHSVNHTDGEAYPSHQWCQGLLYYHLATGDPEALRIAQRIGDNLAWFITGPRKNSVTYSGREAAWPLLSLSALYEVTHDEKYRAAGMHIIDYFRASLAKHGKLMFEYPGGSGIFSPYMNLMTFNGIWDMYHATGDPAILELWKTVTAPEVEALSDPGSWGYLHFRNWPIKWADLSTLMRWYHLTGDKKYVDLGRNGLRLVMAGCPQPQNQTQGFIAMGYRHFIFFLSLADEFGMIEDDRCVLVW